MTEAQWMRLLVAYKAKPGAHTEAARLAGLAVNTARKAWDHGFQRPVRRRPIREIVLAPAEPAGQGPLPDAAPLPPGTDASPAALVGRIDRVRYDGLVLADKARQNAQALADAYGRMTPALSALADDTQKAIQLLRERRPADEPPETTVKIGLELLRRAALVGRYASLMSKSALETDRQLVEALRTPFAVEPRTDGDIGQSGGGDGDADDINEEQLAREARAYLDRVDRKGLKVIKGGAGGEPVEEAEPEAGAGDEGAPGDVGVPQDGGQQDSPPEPGAGEEGE